MEPPRCHLRLRAHFLYKALGLGKAVTPVRPVALENADGSGPGAFLPTGGSWNCLGTQLAPQASGGLWPGMCWTSHSAQDGHRGGSSPRGQQCGHCAQGPPLLHITWLSTDLHLGCHLCEHRRTLRSLV